MSMRYIELKIKTERERAEASSIAAVSLFGKIMPSVEDAVVPDAVEGLAPVTFPPAFSLR